MLQKSFRDFNVKLKPVNQWYLLHNLQPGGSVPPETSSPWIQGTLCLIEAYLLPIVSSHIQFIRREIFHRELRNPQRLSRELHMGKIHFCTLLWVHLEHKNNKNIEINRNKALIWHILLCIFFYLSWKQQTSVSHHLLHTSLDTKAFQLHMPLTNSWTSPQIHFLSNSPFLWDDDFMCPVSKILVSKSFLKTCLIAYLLSSKCNYFFLKLKNRKAPLDQGRKRSKHWRGVGSLP